MSRGIDGLRLQSDYDVCVECGSFAECEHDREMTVPASVVHPLSHDGSSEIDHLEMRTVRPIHPLSQVFNTYGSLPNAVLLSRYGFILPENEHDTVRMVFDLPSTVRNLFTYVGLGDDHAVTSGSLFERLTNRNTFRVGDFTDHGGPEVYDKEQQPYDSEATPSLSVSVDIGEPCARRSVGHPSEAPGRENRTSRLLRVFTHVAGMWDSDVAWDEEEDGLVFNGDDLVVNADGKMSHKLWLLCVLVALCAARSYLGGSFGDAIESLTELKATLISVQGWVERLRDMQDGDGDVEDGGNQGSTRSPPLPHLGRPSDDFAQPVQVESRPARGTLTTITVPSGSIKPHYEQHITLARPLGSGPRGPEITTSQATEESSPSSTRTDADHAAGYRPQRDRSRSADRGRPSKRVRRTSDSVVANRESCRVDGLGRTTPGSARVGQDRKVLDASDGDDATRCVALLLARTVVGLCHDRYRPPTLGKGQRGVGMTAAQLGDLLDVSVSHTIDYSWDVWMLLYPPLRRP
ncbi:hypothetical protein J3R82DRAFT_2367 [Butyriboletus roseoflavus]|nr:hypothetical protein J3R82DRAFT_2367 [Butyriboletus roseoflavus]